MYVMFAKDIPSYSKLAVALLALVGIASAILYSSKTDLAGPLFGMTKPAETNTVVVAPGTHVITDGSFIITNSRPPSYADPAFHTDPQGVTSPSWGKARHTDTITAGKDCSVEPRIVAYTIGGRLSFANTGDASCEFKISPSVVITVDAGKTTDASSMLSRLAPGSYFYNASISGKIVGVLTVLQ